MYYQISSTGYPVISRIQLEGFIKYDEANKPQELKDAEATKALLEVQAEAKQAKQLALDSITVTTASGKVFDGRDKDQSRMLSAIQASGTLVEILTAQYNDIAIPSVTQTAEYNTAIHKATHTLWKLHDNSTPEITLNELKEAHALAIQTMGAIIVGA